jgi:hypothetical protein
MGLMKVFSGSEILAMALKEKIEAIGVDTVMKIIFNRLDWRVWKLRFCCGGFIQETDFAKSGY